MAGGGIKINNIKVAGGADGATFVPHVDENGNLSWSNNKGYTNPQTINIKGSKGDKGDKGDIGSIVVDTYPTPNSQKAVSSGGVYNRLNSLSVDISRKQDILTAGNGIVINGNIISSTNTSGGNIKGVNNNIATYNIVSGASLSVNSYQDVLYEVNIADLPIKSKSEIVAISLQYNHEIFGSTNLYAMANYYRTSGDNTYNRYVSSPQSWLYSGEKDNFESFGYVTPSDSYYVIANVEIPPFSVYVYDEDPTKLVFKIRFFYESNTRMGFAQAFRTDGTATWQSTIPAFNSNSISKFTFKRIEICYVSAEVELNEEDVEMKSYDCYASEVYFNFTAPIGLEGFGDVYDYLHEKGYTDETHLLIVNEYWYEENMTTNAGLFAGQEGNIILYSNEEGFPTIELYNFDDFG
jgi:hypothetical protein